MRNPVKKMISAFLCGLFLLPLCACQPQAGDSVSSLSPSAPPSPSVSDSKAVLLEAGLSQEEADQVWAALEEYAAARSRIASGQDASPAGQISDPVLAVTRDWADCIRDSWEADGIYLHTVQNQFTELYSADWDASTGQLELTVYEWLTMDYSDGNPDSPATAEYGAGGEHTVTLARDGQGVFVLTGDVYPPIGATQDVWSGGGLFGQ